MNVIDFLDRGLFALGELLRAPVVVLLWACVLWVLSMAGAVFADHFARKRVRKAFSMQDWSSNRSPTALPRFLATFNKQAETLPRDANRPARLEELLERVEADVRKSSEGPKVLVKVGPSIGLLGTLIPMGGSLAALSQGNLEGMSSQMIAAFTSTIIGLATGTLAYALAAIRQRWIAQDIRELRLLADLTAAASS